MKQFLKWAGVAQKTILEREAGPVYPLMCTGPCQSIIGDNSPAYRCFDCYRPPVQCKTCAVASHQQNPFHRIEEWQPALGFWQRRPLYDLGLVIQIGHPGGGTCYSSALPRRMTVVHEHGIHPAAIKYCECGGTANTPCLPEPLQLIRFGLFPGSWHQPETVYTINGLRDYHLLSLQSPITTMDYAAYLRRTTDNVQPDDAKVTPITVSPTKCTHTFLGQVPRAQHCNARVHVSPQYASRWPRSRKQATRRPICS